ncbi:hypothetical protein BU24DRAFT_419792 [Aaosphaeria arxii CBS 175.79]|uniref:Uncharacterized protein n=1 Tax=Aaosphaeria arxii CBS 175.79 TaxID=1450172 RepID=A0A6A5Y5B6_9PLEO|nr:uncharacterized protein BU24DRAFT_419792 [Aaosphaeria arxii CBS 175.79]KAF2020237.1 hypothetical protein BU24DRAFT_419792 [Aaosphaeria arxii CBS 175.79]
MLRNQQMATDNGFLCLGDSVDGVACHETEQCQTVAQLDSIHWWPPDTGYLDCVIAQGPSPDTGQHLLSRLCAGCQKNQTSAMRAWKDIVRQDAEFCSAFTGGNGSNMSAKAIESDHFFALQCDPMRFDEMQWNNQQPENSPRVYGWGSIFQSFFAVSEC